MKFLKGWDIVYDKNCDKFYPGDAIRGRVVVEVEAVMTLSKIDVRFKGKAEVTMFIGDYDTQRVTYFNHESTLFKCPESVESVDLDPGRYEYPFVFYLPPGLPYTFAFEGDECGVVCYSVQAIVYRPRKYTFIYAKPFKIEGVLDLNSLEDSREEVKNDKCKSLKCWIWNRGKVEISFSVPKKGYVPGEAIPLRATVKNHSKQKIAKSVVYLLQHITMTVYGTSSVRSRKICYKERGSILQGGEDDWDGESLTIPADLPPSSMKNCELIDVQYHLQLVIYPTALCKRVRVPLEIVLGTVPLSLPEPERKMERTRLRDGSTSV